MGTILRFFCNHVGNKGIGTGSLNPPASLVGPLDTSHHHQHMGIYPSFRQPHLTGVPKHTVFLSLCLWIL